MSIFVVDDHPLMREAVVMIIRRLNSKLSVVELDRIAGEPLDLLVNNTVVAQGEIVLVNDRYGVRLTRVAPASERMKNL